MNSLNKITDLHLNVSVCICTRNRPEDLSKALKSVGRSTYPAFEVVVSDDSTNDNTKKLISSQFPLVKFLEGPRKGLGANRNNALRSVTGSHVLFIDDDVVLNENFLEIVCDRLAKHAQQESIDNVIISGIENKNGQLIFPGEQSFLGYQNVSYKELEPLLLTVLFFRLPCLKTHYLMKN